MVVCDAARGVVVRKGCCRGGDVKMVGVSGGDGRVGEDSGSKSGE
jgi:hypothetical protein